MILRESGLQDLEAMAKVIITCRETMSLDSEINWNKESLQQAIVESSCRVFGAYVLSELVGFILFKELGGFIQSDEKNGVIPCLEVWCLATHPSHQGKGIMGALLQKLKSSTDEVWLEVHESNLKAIEFYKNQLFQQVRVRPNYYKNGKSALLFTWKAENREID